MAEAIVELKVEKKNTKKDYITAVGRRKAAVARVRLFHKVTDAHVWGAESLEKGKILVNKKPIEQYFTGELAKTAYHEVLRVTNTIAAFAITINVRGGGLSGQLDAVVLALSRALSLIDPKHRTTLKKRGYLTRDPRVRERRKVGTGGKARRKKQSPKR